MDNSGSQGGVRTAKPSALCTYAGVEKVEQKLVRERNLIYNLLNSTTAFEASIPSSAPKRKPFVMYDIPKGLSWNQFDLVEAGACGARLTCSDIFSKVMLLYEDDSIKGTAADNKTKYGNWTGTEWNFTKVFWGRRPGAKDQSLSRSAVLPTWIMYVC